MRSCPLLLFLLALPLSAPALHHDPTIASGYVTAIGAPRSFSVEGASVRLEPNATYATERAGTVIESPVLDPLYLGEFLRISGRLDRKARVILATRVLVIAPEPAPVSGIAIIDQIPSPSQTSSGDRIVRADGYLLHLTPGTGIITVPRTILISLSTDYLHSVSGKLIQILTWHHPASAWRDTHQRPSHSVNTRPDTLTSSFSHPPSERSRQSVL